MKLFYHSISTISLLLLLIFSTSISAENRNLIECDAGFWVFPEGPATFFEPHHHYDEASYFWDFGDGNSSTEISPFHEYEADPDNFVFVITLTITLADGETCSYTEEFELMSEECNSMFEYEVQSDGLTVNFEDGSWGIITSWFWDFGDGNTSNLQHPIHEYEVEGDYFVTLAVACLGGETNEMQMPVNVSYEPIECYAGIDILDEFGFLWFSAYGPQGSTYHWDFGDGNTSEDEIVQHNYEGANGDLIEVVVTLTVTTPDGQTCSTAYDLVHIIFIECNAMFEYYPTNDDPLLVQFFDTSWGEAVSWTWDFGDGNTSNEPNPVHLYNAPGEYIVNLIIECEDGQISEMPMLVHLESNQIICDSSFQVDWNGNEYYFYPNYYDPEATYYWVFGDGNTSNEMTPIHFYNGEPGDVFVVDMTLTLPDGQTCTESFELIIEEIDECTSMFEYWVISDDGLTIEFNDQSWGNINNWSWDFGDGNSSTEQHPVHTYSAFADYEVFLTIECANGEVNTMVMPVHVGNGGDCDAYFGYGQELNEVYFYPYMEFPETSYLWDFGDGNSSTEMYPIHQYDLSNEPMEINVTLTLILADGTTCTFTQFIFLEPLECTSMFSYYPINDNEFEIQFIDESWGIPTSFEWDFGDGNTSTEQNPIHTYAEAGIYDVTLTINCVGGETNSMVMDAVVGDVQYCEPGFWYDIDFSQNTFYFHPYTIADDAVYNWDFGDGAISNEQTPVHTYIGGQEPLEFLVTLEVILSDGQICTYEEYIFVEPVECTAMFEYGSAPDNSMVVTFWDTSWGTVSSWFWDFGDGHTSTEQNPTHVFETDGVHYVTLTITCIGGEVNTITMEVHTDQNAQCEAAFTHYILDDWGVYFESALIYDDATYFWDFGDGEFSEEMMPIHYYQNEGWYPIFLEIILPNGTLCHYESEILIGSDEPVLPIHCEAFFNFEQAGDPMTIFFFNQSFTDNDEIEFQWHFGDGAVSNEPDPVHQYETPGVYIVTLTIVSGDCINTFPMQIFIGDETWYPEGCQALFLPVETSSGYIFYDLSQGNVASYLWDFGDGNLSTNETPFHNYALPGDYEITLTIITEDGCESMFSITISSLGFMGNAMQAYMVSATSDIDFVQDPIIYPNPVSDVLNVSLELDQFEEITIEVISMEGKLLRTYNNTFSIGGQVYAIPINDLPSAMYMIKVTSNSKKEFHTRFAKL